MKALRIMSTSDLQPSPKTFRDIERFAESVLEKEGFDRNQMSIRDFVTKLGGKIEILREPDYKQLESGSLDVRGHRDFTIYLSPFTSVLRDNFTVAHELGHLFLHTGEPWGSLPTKIGRYKGENERLERIEQQANRFAAALLMPRDDFKEVAERTKNDLNVLAGRFSVSLPAAEARLKSLGLA